MENYGWQIVLCSWSFAEAKRRAEQRASVIDSYTARNGVRARNSLALPGSGYEAQSSNS